MRGGREKGVGRRIGRKEESVNNFIFNYGAIYNQ